MTRSQVHSKATPSQSSSNRTKTEKVSKYLQVTYTERLIYEYSSVIQPVAAPNKSSLTIDVRIPNGQKVLYIPGTLETLKFAWI